MPASMEFSSHVTGDPNLLPPPTQNEEESVTKSMFVFLPLSLDLWTPQESISLAFRLQPD